VDRYQSAGDLHAALEALQVTITPALRRPLPSWVLPAAAAMIAFVTGLGVWVALRPPVESLAATPLAATGTETQVLITGRQVAMLDFSNRTGDPALDTFGRMVSESMAAALASEGIPVVGATEASAADGLTIAGVYTVEGDDLRFDARLIAASRGTVMRALDPVRVPRSSLRAGAEMTRNRIVSAVLAVFASQPSNTP
jgi:TolB-like protein